MGIVYSARDLRLGRRVALKALPPVHDGDAALRERLRREARAAATISHPAVATVYALEEIDGHLFIVSEFVEGHTLRSEIERAPLEPSRALAIAADIARALCAAHDAGVVHRDLKPENVLITAVGAVKVVDFGIAQLEGITSTRLTRPGAAVGTPAYMPPEQLLGAATDLRADIYAFGVVLTEMLTGLHPLTPGRRAMPVSASDIAWRCIQTDPNERYQSARELLAALEREIAHPSQGAAEEHAASALSRTGAVVVGISSGRRGAGLRRDDVARLDRARGHRRQRRQRRVRRRARGGHRRGHATAPSLVHVAILSSRA